MGHLHQEPARRRAAQDGVTVKYGSKPARFLAAATTAVVAGALVSCSSGSSDIDENAGIEGETVRVTLADHVWTETIKELIPEFEAETGATVEISQRSEEHTSELQSRENLVCRLLLEKKKKT